MLKLSILGPPVVEWGGEPAGHFVSVKSLVLLCYLVMHKGSHAREQLGGVLWGEMSEIRAKANLRMALYNLQKLFPGYLTATRTTISFKHEQPYWLDVEAFESGLSVAEEQIANLRATLELYRGEFLEGLYLSGAPEFEIWLLEQRERLRLLLLSTVERLAGHYTNQADWSASIDAYRRLLASDPLREDVHRRLMLVLAKSGQFEAALAQYQTCCRVLHEELRIEPATETTAMYERIQLLRSQLRPRNLVAHHDRIIGREEELDETASFLRNPACQLVTLIGPGGIGKSRLAIHAAAEIGNDGVFLEGVFLIQLVGVATPDLLVSTIADAVQFALQGPAEPVVQLCNYLRDKEMLLVLDNFEHLIDGGTKLVRKILSSAPDVKFLITSRARLNIHEEWLLEIQGLIFPDHSVPSMSGGEVAWEESVQYPAVQMFLERAQRVQLDFLLSEKNVSAIIHICQLVEGMPLGIELAASMVRSVSCQKIAEEIEHNLGFLSAPLRDKSERHRNMLAVFDHSWRFLSVEERTVFKKLSVFRGGFRREAAEHVADASLSILSSLVDKSFLHRNPDGRFKIHELLRQYAEEKLLAVPQDMENARNLHCRFFALFLHDRENHLKDEKQIIALQEIGLEIDNIRTAWRWAEERKKVEEFEKAIEGLWAFYELRGWYHEGEEAFRRAVNRLGEIHETNDFSEKDPEQAILGAALARLGWFYWHQGRYRRSSEVLQQCLALFPKNVLGARREKGFCLLQLGIVNLYLGTFLESRQFFQESLAISKEVGDNLTFVLSLNGLCFIALALGEYTEAKQKQEESLVHLKASGDRRGIAHNLIWFGCRVCIAYGGFGEAERMVRDGMAICKEINDKFGIGLAFNHFGVLSSLRGDYPTATKLYKDSRDVFREIGDQWGLAYALNGLGYAECALGERKAAGEKFREALNISADVGALPVAMDALVGLATGFHVGEKNEKERALELLEFVLNHHASEYETKNKAMYLITEIEVYLPREVVSTARTRGKASSFDTIVEEILGGSL